MSDIRTAFIDFAGDLVVTGPSLDEDDGLETAVVISLFTDRRAQPGDTLAGAPLPEGGTLSRRGWWGDNFPTVAGDRIGSRLWLLAREKQLSSVLVRAREYAAEALQWLIDDGVARSVHVDAEIAGNGVLGLRIEIRRSDKAVAQYRFDTFWRAA